MHCLSIQLANIARRYSCLFLSSVASRRARASVRHAEAKAKADAAAQAKTQAKAASSSSSGAGGTGAGARAAPKKKGGKKAAAAAAKALYYPGVTGDPYMDVVNGLSAVSAMLTGTLLPSYSSSASSSYAGAASSSSSAAAPDSYPFTPSAALKKLQDEYSRHVQLYGKWLADTAVTSHVVFASGVGNNNDKYRSELDSHIDGVLATTDINQVVQDTATKVAAALGNGATASSVVESSKMAPFLSAPTVTSSSAYNAYYGGGYYGGYSSSYSYHTDLKSLERNYTRQRMFDVACATSEAIDLLFAKIGEIKEADLDEE